MVFYLGNRKVNNTAMLMISRRKIPHLQLLKYQNYQKCIKLHKKLQNIIDEYKESIISNYSKDAPQ